MFSLVYVKLCPVEMNQKVVQLFLHNNWMVIDVLCNAKALEFVSCFTAYDQHRKADWLHRQ